jgi:hypothetical protein
MAENSWSEKFRAVFGAWSIVSSMSGTLVTAYKFLSTHRQLVPEGAGGAGTLTLLVNACLFTAMVCLYGFLTGMLFVYLVKKDSVVPSTLKLACLVFVGAVFLFPYSLGGSPPLSTQEEIGTRLFGVICLACVILRFSPMARWINDHEETNDHRCRGRRIGAHDCFPYPSECLSSVVDCVL